MKSTDARFKVSAYLRMAQLTTDDDLRAEYIAKAEELLANLSLTAPIDNKNIELISEFLEGADFEDIIDKNTDIIYGKFFNWCKNNKIKNVPSKIAFSRRVCQTYGIRVQNTTVYINKKREQIRVYRNK